MINQQLRTIIRLQKSNSRIALVFETHPHTHTKKNNIKNKNKIKNKKERESLGVQRKKSALPLTIQSGGSLCSRATRVFSGKPWSLTT